MACAIQNASVGFATSAKHDPAYVSLSHDRGLLEVENAELMRRNAELKAHMALMQENIALAQARALLEQHVQASKALLAFGQSEDHVSMERPSRKERRQEWMRRNGHLKTQATAGQCKLTAPVGIQSDARASGFPVLLGARSRFTSVAKESNTDTNSSGDVEVENGSRVPVGQRAVMMRNIPLEYTREDVLELIDEHGFQGSYSFFYLPIVFESQLNHGYAFIHFSTAESYERFRAHFSGFSDWKVASDRVCELSFSEKFNSLDDRIESYRNSPIMHDSVEDRFKPVLFEHGQRVPFPEPNKTIKAPRCKKVLPTC